MHIRDNLKARKPLGCPAFQSEMRRGVLAITTSPDGFCVAVLTIECAILVHDKVKEKTFKIQPFDMASF